MVKVGGNEIHIKYVKSRLIFRKQGENLSKVGGNNNFCETGGKCIMGSGGMDAPALISPIFHQHYFKIRAARTIAADMHP